MKYLAFIIFIILISSCESFFDTVIEIDPPEHTPRLAVHAFGGNNNAGEFHLMLTRTYGIVERVEDNLLDSAEITLSSEGQFFEILPLSRLAELYDTLILSDTIIYFYNQYSRFNYYAPDFISEPGKTYILNISRPDFPPVRAQQTAPTEVVPDSAIYIKDAGIDEFGDRVGAIDIYFQDPPDQENFYELRVFNKNNSSESYEYIETAEPGSIVSDLKYIIFSDKVFNGQYKRLRITFFDYYQQFDDQEYVVRWRSISPETFKFNEAMIKYFNSVDNPFLTPTQIYSNIENGVGVFSLYHETLIETRE